MRKKKPAKRKRVLPKKAAGKKKSGRRKKSTRPTPARKDSSAQIHQGVGLATVTSRFHHADVLPEDDVTSEYGGES
jgi:hypothetical protein